MSSDAFQSLLVGIYALVGLVYLGSQDARVQRFRLQGDRLIVAFVLTIFWPVDLAGRWLKRH